METNGSTGELYLHLIYRNIVDLMMSFLRLASNQHVFYQAKLEETHQSLFQHLHCICFCTCKDDYRTHDWCVAVRVSFSSGLDTEHVCASYTL